jgi:hypothetical protein
VNIKNPEIYFTIGFSLWFLACLLLAIMQIGLQLKYGYNKGVLKEIKGGYLKLAKLSGVSFLVGTAIVLIGVVIT